MKVKMTRPCGNLNPSPPYRAPVPCSTHEGDTHGSGLFTGRDQLILDHLPLVKAIAVRMHEDLPIHVELDDLVHAGVLGLFDAVKKYDPGKQVPFASYAKYRIKGAILDSLRELDWASREMRRRQKQVEAAKVELSATLHRAPTEAEIAENLGLGMRRFRKITLDIRGMGQILGPGFANGSERALVSDFPGGPEMQPDSMCIREQLRTVLSEAVRTLPARQQRVVELYYIRQMTMQEIGGRLGINESRVSQILKSAREKIATVLRGNGITRQAF